VFELFVVDPVEPIVELVVPVVDSVPFVDLVPEVDLEVVPLL
jgi:hypothetical protein